MSNAPTNPFAGVNTRADVANLICSTVKQLNYLLYGRKEHLRYTRFTVRKRRGGNRVILAPRDDLKWFQTVLAGLLGQVYRPCGAVMGFVNDRSIATNAEQHVRSRWVLNVDLKDFFPSIHYGMVRGCFMARLGVGDEAATVLAHVCCHENQLPQDAPTSPVVSNMICRKMDAQLIALAKRHNCWYTRYADDLTFSRKQGSFPEALAHREEGGRAVIGKKLRAIIEGNSFRPNAEKTWLYGNIHRQTVTGLVVNTKVNVRRQFLRQIRAMINAWETHGLENAQAEFNAKFWRQKPGQDEPPSFAAVVRGKVEFLKMVRGVGDPVYVSVQRKLVKVDPDYQAVMEKENAQMKKRDVFLSHASEDKDGLVRELYQKLVALGISVWFDEAEMKLGDDLVEKINEGLAHSKFGVTVFSPNFFKAKKTWTGRELSALVAAEDVDKARRILPIWYNITKEQLHAKNPLLVNHIALVAKDLTVDEMAEQIADRVRQG